MDKITVSAYLQRRMTKLASSIISNSSRSDVTIKESQTPSEPLEGCYRLVKEKKAFGTLSILPLKGFRYRWTGELFFDKDGLTTFNGDVAPAPFSPMFYFSKKSFSLFEILGPIFMFHPEIGKLVLSRGIIGRINDILKQSIFSVQLEDCSSGNLQDSFSVAVNVVSFGEEVVSLDPILQFSNPKPNMTLTQNLKAILSSASSLPTAPKDLIKASISHLWAVNVGQGNCTTSDLTNSEASGVLFDPGFELDVAPGNSSTYAYGQSYYRGLSPNGYVVLSHFHTDHYLGAAIAAAASTNIWKRTWIIPSIPDIQKFSYPNCLISFLSNLLWHAKGHVYIVDVKEPSNYGLGIKLYKAGSLKSRNSGIVAEVQVGNRLCLLPGDLGFGHLISKADEHFNVIIVPHHGAKATLPIPKPFSSPDFYCLYCGVNNYGHPNEDTLKNLSKEKVPIRRFLNNLNSDNKLICYKSSNSPKILDTYSKPILRETFLLV